MKKHDVQPNTPEWLELRKEYRTASEAPIVAGISPWTTPNDFKLIKAGLKKQFYSKAMRRGHELEEQVRQHANKAFCKEFKEEIWTNGQYLASLDGIADGIVLEIKVSDHTYNALAEGTVPEYYYLQIQQQLYCSGAHTAYLYAYSPKKDEYICSYSIHPMGGFKERMDSLWDLFNSMPIPNNTPTDYSGDGEVLELFSEYEYLKQQADELKDKMDIIKAQLVEKAGDKTLVAGDFKLEYRKGSTTYDYRAAAKAAKLNLEQYKKEGSPTFVVKLPKNPFVE